MRDKRDTNVCFDTTCRFIDYCKTNVRVSVLRANFKKGFVSGHDFSRAEKRASKTRALESAALFPSQFGFGAAFGGSTRQEDITFAAFNSPGLTVPLSLR
jgi:hypothetical protein